MTVLNRGFLCDIDFLLNNMLSLHSAAYKHLIRAETCYKLKSDISIWNNKGSSNRSVPHVHTYLGLWVCRCKVLSCHALTCKSHNHASYMQNAHVQSQLTVCTCTFATVPSWHTSFRKPFNMKLKRNTDLIQTQDATDGIEKYFCGIFSRRQIGSEIRSENTGKFLLYNLAALTNSIYCNSRHGLLMNRFPVMMTPIGWRELPTIFWSGEATF